MNLHRVNIRAVLAHFMLIRADKIRLTDHCFSFPAYRLYVIGRFPLTGSPRFSAWWPLLTVRIATDVVYMDDAVKVSSAPQPSRQQLLF